MSIYSSALLIQPRCENITNSFLIIYVYTGTRLLLILPSSIFILYVGHQQWRRQRSVKPQSHFDMFTYHLAVLELIWSLGTVLFYGTSYPPIKSAGLFLMSIMFVGETLFHILTCLDRYLAVVHPFTYIRLQNTHGVTIRNICILFTWLFCFLWSHLTVLYYPNLPIIQFFCFLVSALFMVSFCSFSVLYALIRPGPVERDRDRKHVDQMKQRAFYTVMAITGVLCFWFLGFLIATSLREAKVLSLRVSCLVHKSMWCFSLPSSFVLQLLYLHKKGKLRWTGDLSRVYPTSRP